MNDQTQPPYFKTSERPPTKEDGNAGGQVLYWSRTVNAWRSMAAADVAKYPPLYPIWRHQPEPPISEEQAAFERWMSVADIGNGLKPDCLMAWNAALAWKEATK